MANGYIYYTAYDTSQTTIPEAGYNLPSMLHVLFDGNLSPGVGNDINASSVFFIHSLMDWLVDKKIPAINTIIEKLRVSLYHIPHSKNDDNWTNNNGTTHFSNIWSLHHIRS